MGGSIRHASSRKGPFARMLSGGPMVLLLLAAGGGVPAQASCNQTTTVVAGSPIPAGWVILYQQTSGTTTYYTIKDVSCATYGSSETVLSVSPLPPDWVVTSSQYSSLYNQNVYTIQYVKGATFGTTWTVVAGVSPIPTNWVIASEQSGYQTIRCLYGAPYLDTEIVLNYSPIPAGWVVTSTQSSGGYVYYYIQNNNRVTASITTPSANVTVPSGTAVSFVGTGTDTNSSATLAYTWNFGDGNTAAGAAASHAYLNTGTATATYTATLTAKDPATGEAATATRLVSVTPALRASITSPGTAATVYAGTALAFNGSASGGTAPYTYAWAFGDGTSASTASASHTYTAAGTYTATLQATDSTGRSAAASCIVTVNPAVAPSITTQPAGRTVTAGQTATFSVAVSGTAPFTFQWKKNGAAIAGATSSSYTTPATTVADSGSTYSVTVANSVGSVTSSGATLTVLAPVAPSITTQPASQTVTAGQTATFSVAASGTAPFSYQWRKNGTAIAGATAATYITPATAMADSGAAFSVVVGNAGGSATSNAATLTVLPAPIVFQETEPNDATTSANILPTGVQSVDGEVASLTDNDYFSLSIPPGKTLSVKLDGEAKMSLLDAGGTALGTVGTGGVLTKSNPGTSAMTVYFRVYGYTYREYDPDFGRYLLVPVYGPYTLTVQM